MAFLTPSTPIARRTVSLPATKPISSPDQIEVLYNLPSARIISFSTSSSNPRPSSSNSIPAVEEEIGILSWSSRFERTIAVGPLSIYRAPGSVAFLNCSNALRPILPKSQCWEVDGAGKFVLQIRKPHYWRIEVPNKTELEQIQIEELKGILAKVLLFERTPCPFQRDFIVELPEASLTPIKKRPWKPKLDTTPLRNMERGDTSIDQSASVSIQDSISTPSTARSQETTATPQTAFPITESEPHSFDTAQAKCQETKIISGNSSLTDPSSSEVPEEPVPVTADTLESSAPEPQVDIPPRSWNMLEEDPDSFSDATDDTNITPRSQLQPAFQSMTMETGNENRPQALQNCSRSITAPPVLSLITSPPSKRRTKSPLRRTSIATSSESDFSSSVDSFHSVQSWHSPLAPPSPPASASSSPTSTYPYPHENIVLPKRLQHTRDTSEMTVTPETPYAWELSPIPDTAAILRSLSPPPKTPTLVTDSSEKSDEEQYEIVTPPSVQSGTRHRATTSSNSRRRTLSPLPAAINLFSPSPKRRNRCLQTARHLPTAIIQKTCEILLSPPSHLLQLMLNIASKIAAGEWRGVLSGHGEAVHWDFEDEYAGEGWTEDDFGISLSKPQSKPIKPNANVPGGSWEVD